MKKNILTFIKGVIIGGSMLVPGVSGGTMAILLNIYDQLISAVNSVASFKFKKIPFLLVFCLGAGVGILTLSNPLYMLIEKYPQPTLYFFIGAVVGGLPLMFRKAKVKQIKLSDLLWMVAGLAIVLSLRFLPENLFRVDLTQGLIGYLILGGVGIFIAIALVLPGISTSFMLLTLGIYDTTIKAISEINLKFLLPLAIGTVVGILLTTGILEKAMTKKPRPTYLMIIGFVIGSVLEIKPGIPTGINIPLCLVLFLVAAVTMNWLSKLELK